MYFFVYISGAAKGPGPPGQKKEKRERKNERTERKKDIKRGWESEL